MTLSTLTKCHTLVLSILTTPGVIDYEEVQEQAVVLMNVIVAAMCSTHATNAADKAWVDGENDNVTHAKRRPRKKRRVISDSSDEEFLTEDKRNVDEPSKTQTASGQVGKDDTDSDSDIVAYTKSSCLTCFEKDDVYCIVTRGVVLYQNQCVCVRLAPLSSAGSDTYHPVIIDRFIPSGIICRWFMTDVRCIRPGVGHNETTHSRRVRYNPCAYEVGYNSIVSDLYAMSRLNQERQMASYKLMLNCWWQNSRQRVGVGKWNVRDYIALHSTSPDMLWKTQMGEWLKCDILAPLAVYGTKSRWDIVDYIIASPTSAHVKELASSAGVCDACRLDRVISKQIMEYKIGSHCAEKIQSVAMVSKTLRTFRTHPCSKASSLEFMRELLRIRVESIENTHKASTK
jgi:hypothetical protein